MSKYDFILPEPAVPTDSFRFGLLTSLDPARVMLDGDSSEVAVAPVIVNDPGIVGSRVLILVHNRQLIVLGRLHKHIREMDATTNLNNLQETGHYYILGSGNTSLARNWPIELAGVLEVHAYAENYTVQTYSAWSTTGGYIRRFTRHRIGGTWRAWGEEVVWTPWENMTYTNGASTYSGGNFGTPAFRMGAGTVELTGMVAVPSLSAAQGFTTLPTGFRPANTRLLTRRSGHADDTFDIRVSSGGVIYPNTAIGASYINLIGLSFRLEN